MTWPKEVTSFLRAHSKELRLEREADRDYALSPTNFRLMNGGPSMPRCNEAKALIASVMAHQELLAFHATRLIDIDEVQRRGLLRLNLEQQINRLKAHLSDAGAYEELAEDDDALAKILKADSFFSRREGAVWATPCRKSLHDGGCDVFFGSYGGEAIERMAGCSQGKLELCLKQIGNPAVIIVRYPAYGWCEFTHSRLPQSMIELHLQHEGEWEAMDYGWDIMIKRDIPAQNIVAILPPDHSSVAS